MHFGATMFFTDYSMSPTELGRRWRRTGSNPSGPRNTHTFRPFGRRRLSGVASSPNRITT